MAIGPVGGVAYFKANGMQYTLRGELMIQPNSTQNEWDVNADNTTYFTQKPLVPFMQMKIGDSGGLSIQQLAALQGITITAELLNGKVYTLQGASPWGDFTLDAIKGEITGKFGCTACYEQTSS